MKSKYFLALPFLILQFHLHAQISTVNNLSLFTTASDCPGKPDATVSIDSVFCYNGQIQLLLNICNLGDKALPPNTPFSFYNANPTTADAGLLAVGQTTGSIDSGICLQVIVQASIDWVPPGGALYMVINDDGNLNTPFSLNSFPNTGIEECSYDNNLDSSALVLTDPGTPDLGPDVILCKDQTVVFHAGPGYAAYLWQDGSTDSIITAVDPGIYWVEATDACGFTLRDSVFFSFSLLPDTQFPDTAICPGEAVVYQAPGFQTYAWAPAAGLSCTDCPAVTIQPTVSTVYSLTAGNDLGCVLQDTFRVEVLPQPTQTVLLEFCPGDSVIINGVAYHQPGVVTDTLPAGTGCDTVRTFQLQYFSLPQPSAVTLNCPASSIVQTQPGGNSVIVAYAAPGAGTTCPCGDADVMLVQGLASGSDFPTGVNQVCYRASDDCGASASCCFTVTVEQVPDDPACEVKTTACIKFEVLGIFKNAANQKTYRMRVTNACAGELIYVAFQLPDGSVALEPANSTVYTAPSGRQYAVRNPNEAPFYSIRFKAGSNGISGGQSDIFEYTLPPQASPTFIRAIARLNPQVYYETHLNVFDCDVQSSLKPQDDRNDADAVENSHGNLHLFPNPAANEISVDLSAWEKQEVRIRVLDALGRTLLEQVSVAGGQVWTIELMKHGAPGVYYVEINGKDGTRQTGRFVRAE